MSVGSNCLNFVLFFTFNHVRSWPRVVLTVFHGFDIRRKKGGVENGVNIPLRGEL
jgi:hypothetical protein